MYEVRSGKAKDCVTSPQLDGIPSVKLIELYNVQTVKVQFKVRCIISLCGMVELFAANNNKLQNQNPYGNNQTLGPEITT